ncbi:MAG: YlxR family protein [Actinomycetota bacterium]|nr:YlxR family protein [Actinomycetota bacterium]
MVRERFALPCPAGPVRTCVGCRRRAAKCELMRVVAIESESGWSVVPDARRRSPGRGAHVHPTSECVDLAISRRAFSRALRVPGAHVSERVRKHLQQLNSCEEQ